MTDDEVLARIWEFTELVAASARSTRQRERVVRASGVAVPPASLAVLGFVRRHQPITIGEVARGLHVDQSTASRQLRPLEEHGLVERSPSPDDGRVTLLTVSTAGDDVLDRTRAVALHDFSVALDDWSRADRERLAELLDRFRQGLLEARPDESGWSYRPGTEDQRHSA